MFTRAGRNTPLIPYSMMVSLEARRGGNSKRDPPTSQSSLCSPSRRLVLAGGPKLIWTALTSEHPRGLIASLCASTVVHAYVSHRVRDSSASLCALSVVQLTVGMAGTAGAIHFSKPAGTTVSTSRLGPPLGIVSRVFEHGAREKVAVVGVGGGGGALTRQGKPVDRPDAAAIPPVGASVGKRSLRVVVPVIVHEPV